MLRNYLTTALRALRRHLGFTAINVIGLGVGIAVSTLLLLFVRSELAVNDLFPNADRIHRIDTWQTDSDDSIRYIGTNPVGKTIKRDAPGVAARTWVYGLWITVGAEGDYYRRDTFLTNSQFFDVFDLPLRYGTPETALDEPRSAVLRADVARTLFGTTDVVGRTMNVRTYRNGDQSYTVTGVWETLPRNSVTQFRGTEYKILLSEVGTWDFAPETAWSQWQSPFLVQFIRLAKNTDVADLQKTIDNLITTHAPDEVSETLAVGLSPLTEVYLSHADNAGWQRIYLVAVLAALVLLIAGINFTNLATARSLDRVREIGVRKTLGAHRSQLAGQFLVEAVLVSTLATVLGAGLAHLGQPLFEQLMGIEFVLQSVWDPVMVGALGIFALVVGLLAGAYPAAVLSGFEPVSVLSDRLSLGWSAGTLRKGLVVVQFALAIALMAGVYVLHKQLQFATSPEAPYPTDRMLVIESAPRDFSPKGYRRVQTARAQLAAQPGIEAASVSWEVPQVGTGTGGATLHRPEWAPSTPITAGRYRVDPHFDETYNLKVTKGRFFREPVTDDSTNVVLNDAAVQQLDLQRPIGAELEWENVGSVTVVGVVESFNVQNARTGLGPVVLSALQPGDWYRSVSVRLATGASGGVSAVRSTWTDVLPDTPFSYSFLDSKIASAYEAEQQTRRLVGAGAGLALFVALLGLIGLTGFTVRRRTKEIGIRKALGASTTSIVRLLSRNVAMLIGLAFLVGGPVAYLLARWWLQDFARRIALTPWPFLATGLVALSCALAAVSVHTLRAAQLDPATTLRDE